MTANVEQSLVEKVKTAMDDCFAHQTEPGGKPRGAFTSAGRDDIARAAIKATLEELTNASSAVCRAMHDGPLLADNHLMDEKSEKWLRSMIAAGVEAFSHEAGISLQGTGSPLAEKQPPRALNRQVPVLASRILEITGVVSLSPGATTTLQLILDAALARARQEGARDAILYQSWGQK